MQGSIHPASTSGSAAVEVAGQLRRLRSQVAAFSWTISRACLPVSFTSVGMPRACRRRLHRGAPHHGARTGARAEASGQTARCSRRWLAQAGWNVGTSWGIAIVPVIVGDTLRRVTLAERLLACGINGLSCPAARCTGADGAAPLFSSRVTIRPTRSPRRFPTVRCELDRVLHAGISVAALPRLIEGTPRMAAE